MNIKMKKYLILILISLINTQQITPKASIIDNKEKKIKDNNIKQNIKSKIDFINCDKFCSKFEPTCPEIYNEVIKLSTEYIKENDLILSFNEKNKNIHF